MGKFEGFLSNQVINQAIIELRLERLQFVRLFFCFEAAIGLVELETLSELLKKLEHILSCLVLHGALEERSEHLVVKLDVRTLLRNHQEALSILLKALAPLKEHYEFQQCVLLNLEVVLHEVLDRRT